jgi:hypothetical protein
MKLTSGIAAPGALHAVDFSNTEDKKLEPEPLPPFGREILLQPAAIAATVNT